MVDVRGDGCVGDHSCKRASCRELLPPEPCFQHPQPFSACGQGHCPLYGAHCSFSMMAFWMRRTCSRKMARSSLGKYPDVGVTAEWSSSGVW